MVKKVTNSGDTVTLLTIQELYDDVLRHEFSSAFASRNLNFNAVSLKDTDYVLFSPDYVNNEFAKGAAKTLDLFQSEMWKQEISKTFGSRSTTQYIKNAFDCDTYASFHKMIAHLAVAQHYPELGASPAFGTISYVTFDSKAERAGVGHEINFYVCLDNNKLKVKYFEPQEVNNGIGTTVELNPIEVSSIFAVRI